MAIFNKEIKLSDEEKGIIKNKLKPYLQKNDIAEARKLVESTSIHNFLLKNLGEYVYFEGSNNIYDYEFYESCITSIDIPRNIKYISDYAFASSQLKKVIIPDGIKEIGREAFAFTQLDEIIIPKSVHRIGSGAFESNEEGLKKLVIQEGVKEIEREAFAGNEGLVQVTIPKSVIKLDKFVFEFCYNIKKIKLPRALAEDLEKDDFDGYGNIMEYLFDIEGPSGNVVELY